MRFAVICSLVTIASVASAETVPERATRLFNEGRAMKARGEPGACLRFEESYRLVAGAGTGFNVAECLEAAGELVRAMELFQRIAAEYGADRRDEAAAKARARADALRRRVGELVIEIAEPLDGLVLIAGGQRIAPAATVRQLVNPGTIEVTATAPGHPPFVAKASARGGESTVVRVAFSRDVSPGERPVRRRRSRIVLALGLGAAGTGAAIAGGVMFVQARGLDADGRRAAAVRRADLATGFGAGGLALVAAAAIVYWTAPRELVVTPAANGIAVSGRF